LSKRFDDVDIPWLARSSDDGAVPGLAVARLPLPAYHDRACGAMGRRTAMGGHFFLLGLDGSTAARA
jgi:hypothetical protein